MGLRLGWGEHGVRICHVDVVVVFDCWTVPYKPSHVGGMTSQKILAEARMLNSYHNDCIGGRFCVQGQNLCLNFAGP